MSGRRRSRSVGSGRVGVDARQVAGTAWQSRTEQRGSARRIARTGSAPIARSSGRGPGPESRARHEPSGSRCQLRSARPPAERRAAGAGEPLVEPVEAAVESGTAATASQNRASPSRAAPASRRNGVESGSSRGRRLSNWMDTTHAPPRPRDLTDGRPPDPTSVPEFAQAARRFQWSLSFGPARRSPKRGTASESRSDESGCEHR